jgi:hypothetical protein
LLEGDTGKLALLADVPMLVPPVGTVYQYIVLPAEVALRLVLVPLQIVIPLLGVTGVGAEGKAFTVTKAVVVRTALMQPSAVCASAK